MEVVKQICQRVAFLKHGVVLAEGKPEELFVKPTEDVKKFLGEEGQVLPKEGVNVQLFLQMILLMNQLLQKWQEN